ncbi:ATP-binding endoribonuclease [Phlyctema vagabunda]|uniref:Diphthine--ammonia ligase n=1 Tax=Phlyctema vagabunda TaxID=108571 RepID=A0ABR4PM24_9HELO
MGSLNAIALISGGKDSFFSMLHCKQNGHRIIALANLYPPRAYPAGEYRGATESEEDLNSFMFQTVGHTIIPFYEQALKLPLYRQEIRGEAVQKETTYSHIPSEKEDQETDETESLMPLLQRIMKDHPSANAVSTGAILSTYQRTRVESVALRLGLIPLSFLWKYPILPPGYQTSLLQDMYSVSLEARIIKVASGGLDERFLWQNISDPATIAKVERAMSRFGTLGDGGVLGEGGEFETLVLDGPRSLFKGKIAIGDEQRKIVYEGGGAAWLAIKGAEVVMKQDETEDMEHVYCRVPDLLDERFQSALSALRSVGIPPLASDEFWNLDSASPRYASKSTRLQSEEGLTHHWSISAADTSTLGTEPSIITEARAIIAEIQKRLGSLNLSANNIISTIILLRNMSDFGAINKIYGELFTQPNPPARVTISCGDSMPAHTNVTIHLHIRTCISTDPLQDKRSLHVQSRSYWAPANIGPYSQAVSFSSQSLVSIAGQIPLVPASMLLPSLSDPTESFAMQTVLSLQHLWRIGTEMQVRWWSSSVVYLCASPASSLPLVERVVLCCKSWDILHDQPSVPDTEKEDEEEGRDLWEEHNYRTMQTYGARDVGRSIPDWEAVRCFDKTQGQEIQKDVVPPPLFVVEVQELPRNSEVEWHAHLGITKGPIEVTMQRSEGWLRYRCAVNGVQVQDMVMIDYGLMPDKVLREMGKQGTSWLSYVDISVESDDGFLGIIPCRSLWATDGRRLNAVLFLLPTV